jgi:hypothetical protein
MGMLPRILSIFTFGWFLFATIYSDYSQNIEGWEYLLLGIFDFMIALAALLNGTLFGFWHSLSWLSNIGFLVSHILLSVNAIKYARVISFLALLFSIQLYFYRKANIGPEFETVDVEIEIGYIYYVCSMLLLFLASIFSKQKVSSN